MSGTEGSIRVGRGPAAEKTRRVWTTREEEVLLAALKELVSQGWKGDNGFRPGYINKLVEALKAEFPGINIKGNSHVCSKLTTWKRNYASLVTMLNKSGVGFNLEGEFKIDCGDDEWVEICKVDANTHKLRGKSWPFYEGWKLIFGKDRATGENAEDIMDAVNDLMNEANVNEANMDEAFVELDEPMGFEETIDASVCHSSRTYQGQSKRQKKSKMDAGMQAMCDLLGQIHRDTNDRLESLSSRIGYQADLGKVRKDVYELIKDIPGLSLDDQFKVGETLADNEKRLEFFLGLPPSAHALYIMHMIVAKKS